MNLKGGQHFPHSLEEMSFCAYMCMNRQVDEMLNKQEKQEQTVYQSAELLLEMIRSDFVNSKDIIALLNTKAGTLPEFFHMTKISQPHDIKEIPIRQSKQFHVAKHTLSQIPYFHSHEGYELIYVLQGCCKQRFLVSNTSLTLQERQACLLSPGTIHAIERSRTQDKILKFMLPTELLEETEGLSMKNLDSPITVFDNWSLKADFYIQALAIEAYTKDPLWQVAVRSYLTLLFVELSRKHLNKDFSILLEDYLSSHIQHATLKEFADYIGYSADYTGYRIRKEMGQSFSDMVVEMKMKKAAQMLIHTFESIEGIAQILGYSTLSGLYKQFQRSYGVTPGQYRKLWKKQ